MLTKLNDKAIEMYLKAKGLMQREEGQDLVEYALLIALVALACTVGMKALATSINGAFSAVGTSLTSYTG